MSTNSDSSPTRFGSHAIIIGGSMAGLLSARVLAEHFDQVTVSERDRFPDGPEFRKGVPPALLLDQALKAHRRSGGGESRL